MEHIIVSEKALKRQKFMEDIKAKRKSQTEVAKELGLRRETVSRLYKKYLKGGLPSLVSKRIGKTNSRAFSLSDKERIKQLISEVIYHDFSPTLLSEQLLKRHSIKISKECLRIFMIEWGLWKPKQQKIKKLHPHRDRRSQFGELIQIDGSPHDWFEGRAPKCCLIVFIDDATSIITSGFFAKTESSFAYMNALEMHLDKWGIPMALYHDRHGIFQVNTKNQQVDNTQFGRLLDTLGIESISAYSPEAKGRVERANKTLQDRLTKQMRLESISDITAANKFLEQFLPEHNKQFAVASDNQNDAHAPCDFSADDRLRFFSHYATRTLGEGLTCQYDRKTYQVQSPNKIRRLQHQKIEIRQHKDGGITLWHQNKKLEFTVHDKKPRIATADSKQINSIMDKVIKKPQSVANHPWRRYSTGKSTPGLQSPQADAV